jgi:hypothetical protein
MEETFIQLCKKGDLLGAQQYYQLNPTIDISAQDDKVFRWTCFEGHLELAQWLLQVCPTIDISAEDEWAFRFACKNGHLGVAQWLLQVCPTINISNSEINDYTFLSACAKGYLEMAKWLLQLCPTIDISADYECPFRLACRNGHLEVAQWLQSLKHYLYVIEYDENGKITDYKIRSKEEANWQKRKYLVWLASNHCPEENKHNLLYKLPSDVSRLIILHL